MNELSFVCNKKDSRGIRLQQIWRSCNIFIPYSVYNSPAYRYNEKCEEALSKGVLIWVQLEDDSYNVYELQQELSLRELLRVAKALPRRTRPF